jgi:hypothetical protein
MKRPGFLRILFTFVAALVPLLVCRILGLPGAAKALNRAEALMVEALTEAGTLASAGAGILTGALAAGRACRPLIWAGGTRTADE